MGKFTNDLDTYLMFVQHHEILESHIEKQKRTRKELLLKLSLSMGAVTTGAILSKTTGHSNYLAISLAGTVLINSYFQLSKYSPNKKDYKIDGKNLDKIDFQALSKSNRERDRRNGKLRYNNPSKYHRQDLLEVEEEFGYKEDNDLPIHYLQKEEIPNRLLREYELYNLKYELPELRITKEELTKIIDIIENWLKQFILSQRTYAYSSSYLSMLYAKGLINYWEEITLKDFINNLNIFESEDIPLSKINELKEILTKEILENNKKQKLTK